MHRKRIGSIPIAMKEVRWKLRAISLSHEATKKMWARTGPRGANAPQTNKFNSCRDERKWLGEGFEAISSARDAGRRNGGRDRD
jgi:hypothetical protein